MKTYTEAYDLKRNVKLLLKNKATELIFLLTQSLRKSKKVKYGSAYLTKSRFLRARSTPDEILETIKRIAENSSKVVKVPKETTITFNILFFIFPYRIGIHVNGDVENSSKTMEELFDFIILEISKDLTKDD
jgi:hypothetical protein